jgi:uncharacterized damage-inducible protein DinB
MEIDLEQLRYPIGRFQYEEGTTTSEDRQRRIAEIAAAPGELRRAVEGLSDEQLDTPFREGGWTVRQVVHHLADVSMIFLTRLKLALTESNPTVKLFEENDWVLLADSAKLAVEPSLRIVEGIHARWEAVHLSLLQEAFARTFQNPVSGAWTLDRLLAYFAYHSRLHTAHITALRNRMSW